MRVPTRRRPRPRMSAEREGGSLFRPTPRERMLYLSARLLALLPDAVKIRLSGQASIVVDGQRLDAQLQVIRSVARGRRLPGLIEPTIAAGRQRYRRQIDVFRGPATKVAAVRELEIPTLWGSLPVRHYQPAAALDADREPIMVYFHGGGFVIGDLETHDEPCRILCRHGCMHVL